MYILSFPEKVNASRFEKRCREIIEPKLKDTQRGFRLGRSTADQSFALQIFGPVLVRSQQNFQRLLKTVT